MPADVRTQACAYLRNGKVTVLSATWDGDGRRADAAYAQVAGRSATYLVELSLKGWSCTCERPADCPHIAAVQLVTGWPSLARRQS